MGPKKVRSLGQFIWALSLMSTLLFLPELAEKGIQRNQKDLGSKADRAMKKKKSSSLHLLLPHFSNLEVQSSMF